ncbi:hypothetical protein V500_00559 [Pseudogymnoascus sp. VKM F-4518 (FW-2643)]|nr:hypothetical protein V500_00559 [Pseudogymnoascus sp. VKM F-4518 (FW-2643)]
MAELRGNTLTNDSYGDGHTKRRALAEPDVLMSGTRLKIKSDSRSDRRRLEHRCDYQQHPYKIRKRTLGQQSLTEPTIDWDKSLAPAPTSLKPLKTARRRAEALNQLYKTERAQEGHIVWIIQNRIEFLPLLKAMARVVGSERDIVCRSAVNQQNTIYVGTDLSKTCQKVIQEVDDIDIAEKIQTGVTKLFESNPAPEAVRDQNPEQYPSSEEHTALPYQRQRCSWRTPNMDIQDEFRELFLRHGPSLVVGEFITKQRDHLDLNSILEETFRRVDLGPRDLVCRQGAYVSLDVEFLVRQGAGFEYGSCDVDKLLEDTYRYIELGPLEFKRRAGACLSPEVEFLLMQGASFRRVPCGLSRLVKATTEYLQQSNQNKAHFLFQQAMHNRISPNWYYFLDEVYKSLLKSVDGETLCHIVHLISRQEKECKIHTLPSEARGICWPDAVNTINYLMDASISELHQRSDKVTIRAQGTKIITSRTILQARSPYFRKLINNNLEERSFEITGLYKTIDSALMFAQSPGSGPWVWEKFEPCDNLQLTENTLDELIDILYAANTFEMVDLSRSVEQHIVIHGKSFIYAKNAQEIKHIAKEANAGILERYCDAFIATNLRTFTLFPNLPAELRTNIWRRIASQPRLHIAFRIRGVKLEIPPHVGNLSMVCRESKIEMQQFWGGPSLNGINFKFDIIWLDQYCLPLSMDIASNIKGARYCATPAPYPYLDFEWEYRIAQIIYLCPGLKALYLITKALTDSDEFEYCRKLTNKEPTTLAEARSWIEGRAHQRLQKELQEEFPHGSTLPRIMLMDENEISRLTPARPCHASDSGPLTSIKRKSSRNCANQGQKQRVDLSKKAADKPYMPKLRLRIGKISREDN